MVVQTKAGNKPTAKSSLIAAASTAGCGVRTYCIFNNGSSRLVKDYAN
jgi:hypothetical protein